MGIWRVLFVSALATLPASAFDSCSVCGENSAVSLPDVIPILGGQPFSASCGGLEETGMNGDIAPAQCALIGPLILDQCGCIATPTAAPVPSASMTPTSLAVSLPPNMPRQRNPSFPNCTSSECIHNAEEELEERNVSFDETTQPDMPPPTNSPPREPSPTDAPVSGAGGIPGTSSPTAIVTSALCNVDAIGSFGMESGVPTVINYSYEVEVLPRTSNVQGILNNDLEPAINQALLPGLFPASCVGNRVRRRLEVLGLAAKPADAVVSDVACVSTKTSAANDCAVVDGRLTLYSDAGVDMSSTVSSVISSIRETMSGGSLASVNDNLVAVNFRTDPLSPGGMTPAIEEPAEPSSDGNSSLPLFAWILIGAGSFVIITIVVILLVRRRSGAYALKRPDDPTVPGSIGLQQQPQQAHEPSYNGTVRISQVLPSDEY